MSTGWHQLPRDADNRESDGGEEEEDDQEEDEEVATEESSGRGHRDDDKSASSIHGEHRIDIGERVDSFWDDGDDNVAQRQRAHRDDDRSLIDLLAQQICGQVIPSYLEQFELTVPDAELVVGSVPLEEIQRREREIEDAKIRQSQLDVERFRQQETRLAQREITAREELHREADLRHRLLLQQKRQLAETVRLQSQRLGYVFQQAESHLQATLRRQQGRVQEVFGRLEASSVPAERRRYRVEWDRIPVTVKCHIKVMRALKDKLPRGQYALLATLYDRLGGHALHWTAWDPEGPTQSTCRRRRRSLIGETPARLDRPNVTRPFRHRGRFFSTDVVINQDVFVVCPPQSQLRPGNVLVFELFLLESSTVRTPSHPHIHDQIVAWAALPLMTPDWTFVDGKFKVPFLRGEMDATMDKYRDIEDMYTRDLSAWLCNLYLQVAPMRDEVVQLVRSRFGHDRDTEERYDVEIDQRNAVYRFAPGLRDETAASQEASLRIRRKSYVVSPEDPTENAAPPATTSATFLLDDGDGDRKKARQSRGILGFWTKSPSRRKRSNRVYAGSVQVTPQREDPTPEDEPLETKSQPLQKPSESHPPTISGSLRSLISSETHAINEDDLDEETTGMGDPENYGFAVNASHSRESAQHMRFHGIRKLQYMRHELFIDLGLTRHALRKMEFWLLVLTLALALWLRVYVHYLSQWLFLKSQRVAVFLFRPQWTTCLIKYTARSVATHTELGTVASGILGNVMWFGFLAISAAVSQAYVGELPVVGSKFLVCVGLATLLDPFMVFVVDLVHHQYDCASRVECLASLAAPSCACVDGDAFKLYTRFLTQEGSGLVGLAITVILYAALTSLSLVAFYWYLLHIHMNGRMLDVYRRLHAQEDELFLPHDCEVPLQELHAICAQATRWKGPRGTQRKVFVHEYILQDPLDAAFQEKSTHIAVYTVALDGTTRELYRHFLKSPDGAIVELFGQLDTSSGGGGGGGGGGDGGENAWQRDAAPGVVSSLALLHNILQDHHRTTPLPRDDLETADTDVERLLR